MVHSAKISFNIPGVEPQTPPEIAYGSVKMTNIDSKDIAAAAYCTSVHIQWLRN